MKKTIALLILLMLVSLIGCSNDQEELINKIDVDMIINFKEILVIDENTVQTTAIRQEEFSDTFEIIQIELLETGWAEFPYESSFIEEENWYEYLNITKDLFDNVFEFDSVFGAVFSREFGLKAKLTITLQSNDFIIECEFYQDLNEQISMMIINYNNGDDINVSKEYGEEFTEIYNKINNII